MSQTWPSGYDMNRYISGGGIYNLGQIMFDRDECATQKRTTVYTSEIVISGYHASYAAVEIPMTLPSYITSGSQFDLVFGLGVKAGTAGEGEIAVVISGNFNGIGFLGSAAVKTLVSSPSGYISYASGINSKTLTLYCPSDNWAGASGVIQVYATVSGLGTGYVGFINFDNLAANFGFGYRP